MVQKEESYPLCNDITSSIALTEFLERKPVMRYLVILQFWYQNSEASKLC